MDDQQALNLTTPDDKMGYDNLGLAESKTSLAPPPYSEENSLKKDCPLTNIYVVPHTPEKPPKDAHYNPYEHRNVKHATTFNETLFHMLKASLGTGILAMPNAFHNSGYVVGLIGTLVIGFLCTYCIHILIAAEIELCRRRKKPSMTYPEVLEAALLEGPPRLRGLAPYADCIVNVFLMSYQIGSCCIYFVFVATNVRAVADCYFEVLDVRLYMVILFPVFLIINWVRVLKWLAPLSGVANFVTIISFAIIAYYVFTDIPPLSDRAAIGTMGGLPLFFGTVLFAMEAIGVVMPLENEMAKPETFGGLTGVLNCAMVPITLLYTFVGFFGYLKYGSDSEGSITLNLPDTEIPAQAVKLMLSFSILVTHALQCYVAIDITWNQKLKPRVKSHHLIWEYVVRTVIVFLTFFFAVVIPNLELFISLVGAFCLSTLGLSFPAFIQLITFWDFYPGFSKILFITKNVIIVLISLLGFTVGVVTSLEKIYEKFFAGS